MVGLLQLPSELELRLKAMTRPRTLARRTAAAGGALALVAIAAAFTTPVPRAAWQLAPASSHLAHPASRATVRVRDARVRVGRSVLRLDSAVYSPERRTLVAPTRAVHVAELRVGDTIPRARGADSVAALARALAERSRQLDSARARIESMTVELRAMREAGEVRDTTMLRERARLERGFVDQTAKAARVNRRFDAALERYYPDVARTGIRTNTRIVFVADSSGRVVRAQRVDDDGSQVGEARTDSLSIADVNPKEIDMVMVRKSSASAPRGSVTWVQLKH